MPTAATSPATKSAPPAEQVGGGHLADTATAHSLAASEIEAVDDGGAISAPTVVRHLLDSTDDLYRDNPQVLQSLLGVGWSHFVRGILRGTGRLTVVQVNMWAVNCRRAVTAIGQGKIYVPSRKAHVPMTPADLTVEEVREAADYLRRIADPVRQRAGFLDVLARQMERVNEPVPPRRTQDADERK